MTEEKNQQAIDEAVSEGGSYEVLKSRLAQQGTTLKSLANTFNEKRQEAFGGSKFSLIGKANVQTESRSIPVDMAQVKGHLLFGYQVYVGLKSTPSLQDVFGLYTLHQSDNTFRIDSVPLEGSFLDHEQFKHELSELFTYYKETRLSQIFRRENMLYLAFQIGMRPEDQKVFRFEITNDDVNFIDGNGQVALDQSEQHDFEWIDTTRDDHVEGEHPHVNIKDRLFVECTGGSLTIKVENNTQEGQGIFDESVEDSYQTISDASIAYAELGDLLLLKVLPNREREYRYYIYNPITLKVIRADALGISAKALPEEHGLLYSHGFALAGGESKQFDEHWEGLRFFQKVSAPNGEDILYIFFDIEQGSYVIYAYNLIEKSFTPPMHSHGYSVYPDGQMLMFRVSENAEAATIHPLRIWQTPFCIPEHYVNRSTEGGDPFFINLGNAELVRALSSLLSIYHLSNTEEVTQTAYETLLKTCQTTLDQYHWLHEEQALGLGEAVDNLVGTTDLIIDEFAKVRQLQSHAEKALAEQEAQVTELVSRIKLASKEEANTLLGCLADLKTEVGNVMALRQHRYMPKGPVTQMLDSLSTERDALNDALLVLLQEEKAYQPYKQAIATIEDKLASLERTADLNALKEQTEQLRTELSLVTEEVAEIETDDPTQATKILDLTTEVSSMLNATTARLKNKFQTLRGDEAKAEFSSQFKLLSQSVTSALEQATTPEKCDEQQAKLIGQLEKLESRFADFDDFLAEIYTKREEIQSTLEGHKEQLVTAQQRRVQNLFQAAEVTFKSIEKRVSRFDDVGALNSFFATDNMVMKLHQLSQSIRDLDDSVKADALDAKLKSVQDQSLRALRDNQDMVEEGGKVLRLGKHKFSINQQDLDLTLVEHHQELSLHITGTEYYEPITDTSFLALQHLARMDVSSETPDVYRAEYLAWSLLNSAQKEDESLSMHTLHEAAEAETLLPIIQKYAAPRYREGYVKGVHDHDAHLILKAMLPCFEQAGLLRYGQAERVNALLCLDNLSDSSYQQFRTKAKNALLMREHLGSNGAFDSLVQELLSKTKLRLRCSHIQSCEYLVHVLGQSSLNLAVTRDAFELTNEYITFRRSLGWDAQPSPFDDHQQWLEAYAARHEKGELFTVEAAAIACVLQSSRFKLTPVEFATAADIYGLLGDHQRIENGQLTLVLDDFISRCQTHHQQTIPNYESFISKRAEMLESSKKKLRLSEFLPRPLTSFVRNKLISESYLPLIGDNFAKQMGTVGENKRTDLMGLLLLISPPGYGKTTLIEYVAHKLGLVFMKINGPSLGHEVTSLDPNDAPDQNAAREVEKLNLALEMGNNVLLYIDDIQHTSAEFLQKFISLCDGTRRIEGSWKGETKTYDMRSKKFAVVMAGNPYTESGEVFKIPDMLANRADIYNLGDMLSDQADAFAMSFIENSLTSSPVLAQMSTRDLNDLYRLIAMAQGENVPLTDLSYPYAAAEVNEITATLEKLLKIQKTVLKVNQQYIASSATADEYRVEPPFKLQGSYRNMNKLTEKVSAVMTNEELNTLITDHYQGEAQTLTSGTEENLLKLADIRGDMTPAQQERWQEIKERYSRKQQLGDDDDRAGQMVNQMIHLNQYVGRAVKRLENIKRMSVRSPSKTSPEVKKHTVKPGKTVLKQQKSKTSSQKTS
nr:DNA repair ATPase [Algicola sagamiensis]